jgi:hypothetical protein
MNPWAQPYRGFGGIAGPSPYVFGKYPYDFRKIQCDVGKNSVQFR